MTLKVNNVVIDDVKLNYTSMNELQLNGVPYWTRLILPGLLGDAGSNTYSLTTLGGTSYNNGPAGNDGALSTSHSKTLNNFSGGPFVSFRNAPSVTGDSEIIVIPSFNTSTGLCSLYFGISSSAAPASYSKIYRFNVYATNAYGESQSAQQWSVTCNINVNQGPVPYYNSAYTDPTLSVDSKEVVIYSGGTLTKTSSFVSRFIHQASAATLGYVRESSSQQLGNGVTYGLYANVTTGATSQSHTISTSASIGLHTAWSWIRMHAWNKYGASASAYWRYETQFTVVDAPPTAAADSTKYTNITFERFNPPSTFELVTWDLSSFFTAVGSPITGYQFGSVWTFDGYNSAQISQDHPLITGSTLSIKHDILTNVVGIHKEWVMVDVYATSAAGPSLKVTFRSRISVTITNINLN